MQKSHLSNGFIMERPFLFSVFIFCCSQPLYATDTNFYFGVGGGRAIINTIENDNKTGLNVIEGGVVKTSEANTYSYEDKDSFSYRVFAGYYTNPNTSFELSLFDLGEIDLNKLTQKQFSDDTSSTFYTPATLSSRSLSLSGIMSFPLNSAASLNVSLGGAWTQQKRKEIIQFIKFETINNVNIPTLDYAFSEVKDDYFDFIYGVGASYKINKSFDTRLDINGIELDVDRIFVGSLNLIYKL